MTVLILVVIELRRNKKVFVIRAYARVLILVVIE